MRSNDPFAGKFEILVADDSPIYRKLVRDALSEDKYTVIFGKNGREASDLYTEHQPAVVIFGLGDAGPVGHRSVPPHPP